MNQGLRVAQLARSVGVSPDAIRYYEREGLLAHPPRTAAGYRHYPPESIDRVRFIQGCQRLGLRLRDIATLLSIRDTGTCPCEPAEQLLHRRITELDAELARLTALRAELVRTVTTLPEGCQQPDPGTWCPPTDPEGR
jgi:DNA-binding transcriptional MerR regulator